MTKMNTKHYMLLMAAALTMAGCAFDDPMEKQKPWEENDSDLPKPVTFSVSTANNVDFTRAAESIVTFNKDEKIRVLVKPLGSEAYTPYDYTTVEAGQNVALTAPDPQPYFPAGVHTTVDAYAFYPATATTGSSLAFTVADYQRDSADYKASDLMMADNRTITKDVDDGKNKLTMKHLMAQLRIKAVPDEQSDLKITKILVEAKRSLFFTPEDATVATTTGEIETITVLNEIDLADCTGGEGYVLIPPQTISSVIIKVVTGQGRPREIASYGFTAEGSFQAGASYGVDITVTPEQLGFTTAIANWNGMGSVLIAPSGDLVIDPIDAQPYREGQPVEPEIKVRKGTTELTKDVHYTVKYLNNIEAGTAYVVVMGLEGTDSNGAFDYTSSVGVAPFTISSAMATLYYDVTKVVATYGDEPFVTPLQNNGDGIVTYTSDDETIATVDAVTGQVTLVKPGTTTIRATAADGANYIYNDTGREVSYTLEVNKAAGSIKFDDVAPSQAWNADESKNYFTQSVTHVGNGTVTYTIPAATNTCGATIDGSTVRFTQGGQVVVTATVENNDYYTYDAEHCTATYTLTVTKALGFVNLSAYSGHVPFEQNVKLFEIDEDHGGILTVASNDETIATATLSAGRQIHVTGVKAGSTKIVVTCAATAQYQEAKAEYTVNVDPIAVTGVTNPTANDLTYTGSPQALVTAGSATGGKVQYKLNENDPWSDNVPTATNVGTYNVYWQVAGDGNHNDYNTGTAISVIIKAKTVTSPTITLSTNSYTYDGTAKEPSVSSVNDGSATVPASEYTVSYSNNVKAGTATVTITDKAGGNYDISGSTTFIINPKAVSSPAITLATNAFTYDGTAKQPTVSSVKEGTVTIPNSEYTVSYSNNVNAGTATVTITDKEGGDYTISGSTTFTINPKTVSNPTITLATTSYTYGGDAKQPAVSSVKDGSTTIASSEYTVSYSNNVNASNAATVTITDKSGGNYTVSGTKTFTINPKALSSTELKFASATLNKVYIWEIRTSTNALTKPSDCTVTYSSNNTSVASVNSSTGALTPGGTLSTYATITATATGNYSGSASYQIKATDKVVNFAYTGGAQSLSVGPGTYQIECWGAQGGSIGSYKGGKGAYTKGNIALGSETLYIYVGGSGDRGASAVVYNNGTKDYRYSGTNAGYGLCAGGGSTDIRLVNGAWNNFNSLKSRIMVAAGGGGGSNYHYPANGGYGGALTGGNGVWDGDVCSVDRDSRTPTGGEQTRGGLNGQGCYGPKGRGAFGYASDNGAGCGGGNGYYAGGGGPHGGGTTGSGAGGSSYISGYSGCKAITSGSTASSISHSSSANHYSGKVFTSMTMTAGNASQTKPGGGSETGHSGDGYARITWVGN